MCSNAKKKVKLSQSILQFCTSLVCKFSYRIPNISGEMKNLITLGPRCYPYKKKKQSFVNSTVL